MIVTVTMNPAIDKTVEIDSFVHGGLNRIKRAVYDAGGKGINVSKTIAALGGKTLAAGFLGGNSGRTISNVLDGLGIENDFVWVGGETRTNTKVFEENGMLTELNEPGPDIPEEKTEELIKKLEGLAGENVLFVLSGSIPKGVKPNIYERITRLVHNKGARVLSDADGELFRRSLAEVPDIIKSLRGGAFGDRRQLYKKGNKNRCRIHGRQRSNYIKGRKKGKMPCFKRKDPFHGRRGRRYGSRPCICGGNRYVV